MPANIDQLNITITADASKAIEELKRLSNRLKSMSGKYSGMGDVAKNMDRLARSLSKAADSSTKAAKGVGDAMKAAGKETKKTTNDMSKGLDSVAKTAQKVKKEIEVATKHGKIKIDYSDIIDESTGLPATAEHMKKAAKVAMQNYGKWVSEYGVEEAKKRVEGMTRIFGQALPELTTNKRSPDEIARDQKELETWKQLAEAERAAKQAEKEARRAAKAAPAANYGWDGTPWYEEYASGARRAVNAVKKAFSQLSTYNVSKNLVGGVGAAISGFKRLGSAAVGAGIKIMQVNAGTTGTLAFAGLARGTRLVANGFRKLAVEAAKVPFKAFAPVVNRLTKAFGGPSGAMGRASSATSGLDKSMKAIRRLTLSAVFGVRSILVLVRRIRKSVGESFTDLAGYSSAVNTTLGTLKGSLNQVSDSIATAFEPVLTAVAPLINKLIDWILSGINALNQFFSALTGRSTWTKATFHMAAISDSAQNAANNTRDANEAAEEYKKTLMGFDKINKLEDVTDSGGGGGSGGGSGGGGGSSSGGTFTTQEIATGISDFAQMVKDAWAESDFTEVGEIVGQKLADALNSIPWDKIQATAAKFGTSFATFINGLVSVGELATALGTTVGEAINTIFIGANAFVANLQYDKIGEFFAKAMNQGINTIQWDLIADTLSTHANGIFNLAKTWAGRFNFGALGDSVSGVISDTLNGLEWQDAADACKNIGKGVAEAINAAVKNQPLTAIAKAVGEAINAAFAGADEFLTDTSWTELGKEIANSINTFFSTFSFAKAGVTVAKAFNSLLDLFNSTVSNISWSDVGASVMDAIKGYFSTFKWSGITTALTNISKSLFDFFTGAISSVDWSGVPDAIIDAIKGLIQGADFKGEAEAVGKFMGALVAAGLNLGEAIYNKLKDGAISIGEYFTKYITEAGYDKDAGMMANGVAIITGIFNGIIDFMSGIAGWIGANIFTPFADGFKAQFGIGGGDSVTGALVEWGKSIANGILNGIKGVFENIKQWIDLNIAIPLERAFYEAIPDWFADAFGIDKEVKLKFLAEKEAGYQEAVEEYAGTNDKGAEVYLSTQENPNFHTSIELFNSAQDGEAEKDLGAEWKPNANDRVNAFASLESGEAEKTLDAKKGGLLDSVGGFFKGLVGGEEEKSLDAQWESGANDRANTFASITGGKVTKEVNVEKGTVDETAEAITKLPAHSTSSRSVSLAKGSIDSDASTIISTPATSTATKTVKAVKDSSLDDTAVKDFITLSGKSTLSTTMKVAREKGWSSTETWQDFANGGKGQVAKADLKVDRTQNWTANTWQTWANGKDSKGKWQGKPVIDLMVARKQNWTANTWQPWLKNNNDSPKATIAMGRGLASGWKKGNWFNWLKTDMKDRPGTNILFGRNLANGWEKNDWFNWLKKDMGDRPGTDILFGRNLVGNWGKKNNWFEWLKDNGDRPGTNILFGRDLTGSWEKNNWFNWLKKDMGDRPGTSIIFDRSKSWGNNNWFSWLKGLGDRPGVSMFVERVKAWGNQTWQKWTNNENGGSKPKVEMSVDGKLTKDSKNKMAEEVADAAEQKILHRYPGLQEKLGGAFFGGSWHGISQFSAGGSPSHGSVFVAGENGAEVVGHLNGRTEVLNQSQMASTMYSAVYGAMMAAIANSPGSNVYVSLEGDARGLFKAVQNQANKYTQMTGQPAFAL